MESKASGSAPGADSAEGPTGFAERGSPTVGAVRVAVVLGLEARASDRPGPAALVPILGRSPFQRHVKHLAELGVQTIVVVLENPEGLEAVCRGQAAPVLADGCELVVSSPQDLAVVVGEGRGSVLLAAADSVFDPRLYRALIHRAPAWMADRADGGENASVAIGLRTIGARQVSELSHGAGYQGAAEERVEVGDIDPYLPDMRRTLRPYWVSARSPEGRRRAADLILDSAQKGVLDFPARYLHPPPEDFLARRLSGTPITPNQVTLFTAVTGFTVTYLFAVGSYGPGLALAFVTNVLDGVDGKLARVRLQTSPMGGTLDHTLDVSFEFSWYLALGWGLSGGALGSGPFVTGLALIATMLGARGVSGVYKLVTGRQIHDHTAFDRAVRLVAGRRNIYVMLLIVGYVLGRVGEAFTLSLVWALTTLGVYVGRTVVAWLKRPGEGSVEASA